MSDEKQELATRGRKLTRRDVLKLAGVGAGGLLLQPASALASGEVDPDNGAAMLYDATMCVGCRSCEAACKEWNDLPPEPEPVSDTTAHTWTLIKQYQDESVQAFRKYQCMHCLHPGCVSVCTVGALTKSDQGPVVYNVNKCIGCRYCQYACPFGVPKFEWEQALGLIGKCTFCADRLADGLIPACAAACPVGALSFGTRSEMLDEARSRISQHPDRYFDHIYGETEAGGTSILFLSPVSFEKLGFPALGSDAVAGASEAIARGTPVIAITAAAVFSGIYWLTKRQGKGAKEEED